MRYYIIAGEASGDLHGSNLMKALKKEDNKSEFRFWGGNLMQSVGGTLVKHYSETAFMGFAQVVANLGKIRANFKLCKQDLLEYNPDVLILIDYPGFNLRMAKFAKQNNIKVYYYISPKIWAWNTKRVYKIKKTVDEMFTILPFETDFYSKYNYNVHYVGNPVLDAVSKVIKEDTSEFRRKNNLDERPIVALLPGSRKQELATVLSVMLDMIDYFPEYQFIIAGAPSFNEDSYKPFVENKDVKIIFSQTYQLIKQSVAALVTSGTATLETALLGCPQIVCYQTSMPDFLYTFGRKHLIKVDYISLVNLILNYEGIKELVQTTFTKELLKNELFLLLKDEKYKNNILKAYANLKEIMGEPGVSKKAATKMVELLQKN